MNDNDLLVAVAATWASSHASGWNSNMYNYKYASKVMKTLPSNWDVNAAVIIESFGSDRAMKKDTSPLKEWMEAIDSHWKKSLLSQNKFFLDELEKDIVWMAEKVADDDILEETCLKILLSGTQERHSKEDLNRWFDIWIDSGWLKSNTSKQIACIAALDFSCEKAVSRLCKDIKDVNVFMKSEELNNCLGSDIKEEVRWNHYKYSGLKINTIEANERMLAFFAKTVETIQALEEAGVDMMIKDSNGHTSVDYYMERGPDLFFTGARNSVMNHLNKKYVKKMKHDNPQEALWGLISGQKRVADITRSMSSIQWKDLRDKNGANIMHILAVSSAAAFSKYALTSSGAELLKEKDNNGHTPWQILLSSQSEGDIRKTLEKKIPYEKVSWAETMMLAVKSGKKSYMTQPPTYFDPKEGVLPDLFIDANKRKTLKTEEGQEIVRLVADKMGKSEVLTGHNIFSKWIGSWESFVSTKKEWEISAKMSLGMGSSINQWNEKTEQTKMVVRDFKKLWQQAIDAGVSPVEIEKFATQSDVKIGYRTGKDVIDGLKKYCEWDQIISEYESNKLKEQTGITAGQLDKAKSKRSI
jgi:hypothetical protein